MINGISMSSPVTFNQAEVFISTSPVRVYISFSYFFFPISFVTHLKHKLSLNSKSFYSQKCSKWLQSNNIKGLHQRRHTRLLLLFPAFSGRVLIKFSWKIFRYCFEDMFEEFVATHIRKITIIAFWVHDISVQTFIRIEADYVVFPLWLVPDFTSLPRPAQKAFRMCLIMYAVSIYYSIQIAAKLSFSPFHVCYDILWRRILVWRVFGWKSEVKSMLLFISRHSDNDEVPLLYIFFPFAMRRFCVSKEKLWFIPFIQSHLFGYLLSIIYGSIFPLHPPALRFLPVEMRDIKF